eukprot:4132894-Amphidinium_carterae.1
MRSVSQQRVAKIIELNWKKTQRAGLRQQAKVHGTHEPLSGIMLNPILRLDFIHSKKPQRAKPNLKSHMSLYNQCTKTVPE